MDTLKRLLAQFEDVEVREKRFDTSDGITKLGDNPFVRNKEFQLTIQVLSHFLQDPEVRIYILSMFTSFAREFLCKVCQ